MKPAPLFGNRVRFSLHWLFVGCLLLSTDWRLSAQPAPTITWAGAASGDWNTAANWSPVRVPDAADHVLVDRAGGARVRLNVAASIASLTLGGSLGATQQLVMDLSVNLTLATNSLVGVYGVLAMTNGSILGTGLLDVGGRWDWAGGVLGSKASVRTGGRLELVTVNDKILSSGDNLAPAVITNLATARHTGGLLYLNYGARVENLGEWRLEKDGDLFGRNAGNFGTFWNRNLFAKVGGAGTATVRELFHWHNFGVVSNASGVLAFAQNSTWADGSVLAGPATNRLTTSTYTLNGGMQFHGPVEFVSGTLTGEWLLGGAGPFRWQGGTVAGVMTWPAALAVELVTPNDKFLSSGSNGVPAVITNQTTVRQIGGIFYVNFGGRLENLGQWRIEKDGDVFGRSGGNFGTFWNRNFLTKVGGTGVATIRELSHFHNFGVVSNASGTLDFNQNST